LVHVEPVPVTVAVPVAPALLPIELTPTLFIEPPSVIVNAPVPLWPTLRKLLLVKTDPVPVTSNVPILPVRLPISDSALPTVTLPPFSTIRVPLPD
jgi:hypothetical protein